MKGSEIFKESAKGVLFDGIFVVTLLITMIGVLLAGSLFWAKNGFWLAAILTVLLVVFSGVFTFEYRSNKRSQRELEEEEERIEQAVAKGEKTAQ